MRLHRLEVEAFGPFAARQVVDFDALSGDGVFLLHGPTGAGKTSLLDAVCFALFGQVPGARREGRPRLRSDHADPATAPQVVLELSIGGRRLEVTRSPEWQRPKKRGTGTTREPASADVRELVDGEWRVLVARRSDEAALLLHALLGMGLEQFTKVVLLPQGEFAAFLRAGAEQRADLLSRLFDIDRYTGVEAWLRDERQLLARRVGTADAERDALVARAQQAALPVVSALGAVAGSPEEVALADPPGPALVDALAATVSAALQAARSTAAVTREGVAVTTAALRSAEELAQRLDQRASLLDTLSRLDLDAEHHRGQVERRDAARRAQRLSVILPRLSHAEAEGADLTARAAQQVQQLPSGISSRLPDGLEDAPALGEVLSNLLEHRARELTHLEDAQAQAHELQRLREECSRLAEGIEQAQRLAAELTEQLPQSHAVLDALRERGDTLLARASTLDAAHQGLQSARLTAQAAGELADCSSELAEHDERRRRARDLEQDAQAQLLDVRERRLRGMAAALAADLADGEACPVCGSIEHPQPAPAGPDHVDQAVEQVARDEVEAARTAREAAEAAFAVVAQRHAALTASASGLSADAADALVAECQRELDAAREASEQLSGCREELQRQQQQHEDATERLQDVRRSQGELQAQLAVLASRRDEVAGALQQVLRGDDDLAARRERVSTEREALQPLRDTVRELDFARTRSSDLRAAVEVAAAELGFADVDQARQAWLSDVDLAALEQSVRDHERLRADTEAVLATPELRAAEGQPRPDVEALRAAVADAEADSREAERVLTISQHAHDALTDLAEQLREHDDVHRELRARHVRVEELSRCVDGTGGGNLRRMRLSAFVLAARLEEVATAASDRLLMMSDGRYTLSHSDDLAKGGARSGLGLQVVDSWTGVAREPATLSGGESFMASLALALGLADVVQAEAAGTDIETLFVDEGFGSLDDDALEEVMTVLDGLRSGGRTVGVVSHVADLRSRIHQRLEVVKTRTGSLVRQGPQDDVPMRAVG
jgi:exonuclease SbcC